MQSPVYGPTASAKPTTDNRQPINENPIGWLSVVGFLFFIVFA